MYSSSNIPLQMNLNPLLSHYLAQQGGFQINYSLNDLEEFIAKRLSDTEKAEVIRKVYQSQHQQLFKVWSGFDSPEFKDWIVSESKFLGSLAIDHMDLALRSFPPALLRDFRDPSRYNERYAALANLFAELQNEWGVKQKEQVDPSSLPKGPNMIDEAMKTHKVVAVLYRKCGNGHVTASTGIKQFLESRGYQVHLIDGGETENAIRRHPIFMNRVQPTGTSELRHKIQQIHPDLIISTVAHHNNWTQIAYDMNVPTLVVHTDYEVNSSVVVDDGTCKQPYVYDNSSLVQYCLPHEDHDNYRAHMKSTLSPQRYSTLVKEMGFPVRESFVRETDPATIVALRKELGMRQGERAVLMMGHREPDTTKMIELIRQLRSSTRSFAAPICIVAVCGDDPALRKKVEDALLKMPYHPDIRVKLEDYLDEPKIAKYMKIISRTAEFPGVIVSKRGGSTTAEITEMGDYSICIPTIAHEACNGDYLARHGLGEPINEPLFVNQIAQAVKWNGDRNAVYRSPFNWRQNLEDLVQQKIRESVLAKLGQFQFSTGNTM